MAFTSAGQLLEALALGECPRCDLPHLVGVKQNSSRCQPLRIGPFTVRSLTRYEKIEAQFHRSQVDLISIHFRRETLTLSHEQVLARQWQKQDLRPPFEFDRHVQRRCVLMARNGGNIAGYEGSAWVRPPGERNCRMADAVSRRAVHLPATARGAGCGRGSRQRRYHLTMIFISYSNKNGKLAAEVKGDLEDGHYSCFLAHDDIAVSTDWHEEIWKALRACDAFVGLVTEEFNASAFCQQEVGAAFALNKPRLLVRLGVPDPSGFASRFQGARRDGLLHALDTLDMFQALRIESWIAAVDSVQNYNESNRIHDRFHAAWHDMSDAKKLRWLLAAAGNSQVRGEGFKAGPFYRSALKKLKPLLTDQWLFDNDKTGVLHDPEDNPISKPREAKE